MSADDAGRGAPAPLSMNDAMALVRYAVTLESASEREAQTHEHTAGIRQLARRIQNEATTGVPGKYTAADVALLDGLVEPMGAIAQRIAGALRTRVN
ncbi:MAG: hypothetical protein KGL38_10890 [Gemmatimonadota bacterium]|nr:hypothetical protein [Gemmatimonadota bacterium]MDE3128503.1 hypothetical protein [Gemmatimonadota bacterium]MDE3217005.1 hypothetical protein [Gemmatimonadota bacterium]